MKFDTSRPNMDVWIKPDPDDPKSGDIQFQDPHTLGAIDADDYVHKLMCIEPETFAIFLGEEGLHRHLSNVIQAVNSGGQQLLIVCSRNQRFRDIIDSTEEMTEMVFEDLPGPDIVIVDSVITFAMGGGSDEQILAEIEHWAQGELGDQ